MIRVFPKIILPIWYYSKQIYEIINYEDSKKQKKVFYSDNFANLYGGAKIVMKSSPKIKYVNSIL